MYHKVYYLLAMILLANAKMLTSKYVLLSWLVSITLMSLYTLTPINNIFAISPSFPIEGISNNHKGWALAKLAYFENENAKNITECTTGQHSLPSPNIAAVDYISDGKTLNATLWLSSIFKEPINSSSFPFTQVERSYGLLIHVDSDYDIGQHYQVVISQDPLSHTWYKTIEKSSPSFIGGNAKVLDQKANSTDFPLKGKNYIDLSLDLSKLGYPSQYSVISYASDTFMTKDDHVCHLIDATDVVHIPLPEFVMSMLPSTVILVPGENKIIEFRIKSNTNINSHIFVYAKDQSGEITSTFNPQEIFVSPSGISTSLLQIKALGNAKAHSYTLPIYAKIFFPTNVTGWSISSSNIGNVKLSNPEGATISKQSNVTVSVVEPLTFLEKLKVMWESWGSPISGFVGLITAIGGAGIVGLLLKKFKDKWNKGKKSGKHKEGW
jgi:hypothetical protein